MFTVFVFGIAIGSFINVVVGRTRKEGQNFEIDLKPFTLIIGENNSGKTNLLNALCLIFSQDITFYKKRVLECEDINCQVVCKFKEEILNDSIDADKVIFPGVVVDVEMRDFSDDQEAVVGDWFIDKELSKANE